MVELFTWSRTDGYSIVKPEIKNKVEIPEMLPHKCATEVLAETEKFIEPIDNYSAGKRILAGGAGRSTDCLFQACKGRDR